MSQFLEAAPAPALHRFTRTMQQGERLLIRVRADLNHEMRFASQWLVVTTNRVLLIESDGAVCIEVPLSKIESAKVHRLVGGGCLVFRNGDRSLATTYFTNSDLTKFAAVSSGIETLLRTGELSLPETTERIRCE